MQAIIETIKEYINGVQLQTLTDAQKIEFKNNYNCKLYYFEYSLNANGDLVIHTKRDNYTNLQYYMGFDHVNNDYIKLKLEVNDIVLVIYSIENERVAGLAKKLGLIG
ncbi:hypothetical protein DCCM_3848 [Desulfocucumis palustris]|uniref:Uncharacterized protein n=1 Tax=Desulfocucumis palustris TaxID=1898651 RepID=A0A2L2XER3_9FIRM|nr:DUF3909 family protein [Desulfocucumis palustris]GBF34728.1 hypothetical protein DCCM_3848 [Desulfocucumis palustris]